MRPIKVQRMSDKVQGVRLHGNPKRQPEPEHFRVIFPGGDVDIVRRTDNPKLYWVHVRVNRARDAVEADTVVGQLTDARLDIDGKHAGDCDAGDFADPALYHLAVCVGPAD